MNDETPVGSFKRFLRSFLKAPMEDREALFSSLLEAKENEILDEDAFEMVEGVLSVSEMQARDIMIPRTQMVTIRQDEPLDVFLSRIIESGHSRFPVIGEDKDTVLGILLAKDILKYFFSKATSQFNIQAHLRPAVFVPESKRLNILLKEFRVNRNHMAIVVDEYGGISGIITIEDILEEIVGEIADEHDAKEETTLIRRAEAGVYIVNALTPVEDFNEYFETALSEEAFDTIGGLVMQSFGHLPDVGEITHLEDYLFEVLEADDRRVLHFRVKKSNPEINPEF